MEYKKVEKISGREDIRQFNNSNILTESVGICRISQTSDAKEIKNNTEDTTIQNSVDISFKQSSAIEVIKDSNFDNEDEWDIDGIPELLNELDADIEKSLKNIQTSRSESKKDFIDIERNNSHTRKETTYIPKSQNCSKSNISFQRNFQLSATSKNKSASTFAGFSKGGHLISTSPNSSFFNTTKLYSCKEIKTTKNFSRKDCIFSMSSQSGNNGNPSSNLSGTGLSNLNSVSSSSSSNNSNKSNNKMSIDHQATLDKGLKMKIKRTKPGTKSSEAKHEIVKAIEQQQNGLVGGGNSACSGNQEDITCVISVSNQATNSQNSNMTLGINNSQVNSNVTNNKKNLGSGINQTNNSLCNSANISLGNSVSSSINSSQSSVQGAKRGSSSHRRDKTKEKSSHSNRLGIEKNSSNCTEKDSSEKVTCHCVGTDANISNSSNCSCNRKTETNTLTQRLTTQNTSSNTTTVPPGVFTPSAESSNAGASGLLAVTTTISTPITTQTTSSSINANAPGPPTKEVSINSGSNIKISSHIAAQLAAAAASTNSANGSNITTSTFPNSDMKTSASNTQQIGKHIPSGQISSTAHHSLSSSNNKSVTSTVADSMSSNISSNEISESPPPKRIKHLDNNIAESSNKEMVDMCIGTSVGTITEPECLGPCEPGTSVTLEGIVWHETEGGVLVVNVTWRGKTYVGTLLDCTRHDWAPPRFCDSPTDDLDTRTPKGRGKRGRATITPDLSNFTETRSSIYFSHSHVHSKLRNGSNKGGRGTSRTTSVPPVEKNNSGSSFSSGNGGSTPSTSPTAFLPPRAEKRKSKDESPPPVSQNNESSSAAVVNASGISITSSGGLTSQTQSFINPVTGLNVQINTKRCKTSPCAISPVLLECPEQDCSKKYKHVNGLRYHQSHAHGSATLLDEDSMAETEEHVTPQPSPVSSTPTPSMTPNPSDILLNTQITISQQLENSESNTTKLEDEKLPLQLENFEKDSTSETASSLPGEDILTESNNKKVSTINSSSSISITSGTSHNETQKQFLDIVGNKISTSHHSQETNSQLTPHSPTGKSGVLRFGQVESTTASLSTSIAGDTLSQAKSDGTGSQTDLPEKCAESHQERNKDTNSNEVIDKPTLQHQNNKNIVICKDLSPNSVVSKPKKGRKTPTPTDYDTVEVNTCNISSREDVQSPAYSDISDDSAPVNESDILDKGTLSKNPEILKKSADVGLSPSATCPTNPNNMPSTLGSYGVYQFYQQQQFIVPSADQQSSEKNMLSPNNTTISPSLTQQGVSEYNAKKDQSLDLMSKGNTNQHCPEISKDCSRPICVTSSQGNSEIANISSIGALTSTAPSKNVSHFYAFNYMPPNYPFNVDSNYGSSSAPVEDITKQNRLAAMSSPSDQSQQHSSGLLKDERSKDDNNSTEAGKPSNPQISTKSTNKTDTMVKSECIKQESSLPQIPQHMPTQSKEQGIGAYTNIYQRHPLTLASQQLSREEELRRYYIFSDQQRRQNSSSQNPINQQLQNASQPGNQQCKDDPSSSLGQHIVQSQQQIKIKSNTSLNINKSGNSVVSSKESPKHKQDEEIKVIKQEGQKPTMETQGPPPPPTSQYFLHPSYITSTPFGFDPSHPMYRNVLMPTSSPYNTPPYHLPMPRYHAPEDLSRNTGTKALDALHHAASQYYTTHKIHELSERALKSPNNNNSNNSPGTIKISGTSPNIGTSQHSNMCSNIMTNHSVPNQTVNVSQIQHNISTQGIAISNKQDVTGQKTHPNGTGITGTPLNEQQKPHVSVNSTISCTGNGNNNVANSISNLSTSDSRSPPPQRHVHTHHHTHVGLGYPMYPAPYGAAVLASQQAAAVAVINPFPTGPNK